MPRNRHASSALLVAFVSSALASGGCKDDHYKELAASTPSASAKEERVAPPHESPFAKPSASGDAEKPPETVICQHVLIAWRGVKRAKLGVTRTKEEAKTLADDIAKKAKDENVEFTDLVKKYSDDPAAIERLGSTGKFKRPDMDKKFSDTAFALKVGQISDVIETQFGYHVIKRNQ